jgi:hypothetical protein
MPGDSRCIHPAEALCTELMEDTGEPSSGTRRIKSEPLSWRRPRLRCPLAALASGRATTRRFPNSAHPHTPIPLFFSPSPLSAPLPRRPVATRASAAAGRRGLVRLRTKHSPRPALVLCRRRRACRPRGGGWDPARRADGGPRHPARVRHRRVRAAGERADGGLEHPRGPAGPVLAGVHLTRYGTGKQPCLERLLLGTAGATAGATARHGGTYC